MTREEAISGIVELLRPFMGTGEKYFEDDPDDPAVRDLVGPDEPVRNIIRDAMERLDVSSGYCCHCRLCLD